MTAHHSGGIATKSTAPAKKATGSAKTAPAKKKATPAKAAAKKGTAPAPLSPAPCPYLEIPLGQIHPAADNLRVGLHQDTVDQLAASIAQVGLIEPLIVTPTSDGYQIVAGHHRHAALQQAKATVAPCVIRTINGDDDRWVLMLIENLQRRDLDPIEEATGYSRLVKAGWTQTKIAATLGCSQSHVSKRLAIAKLPGEALHALYLRNLEITAGEALAKLRDTKAVLEIIGDGTKKIASWKIDELVRTQERNDRTAASKKAIKEAGLKTLDSGVWYRDYEKCAKAIATHASIDGYTGSAVWLCARAKDDDEGTERTIPSEDPAKAAERTRRQKILADLADRARAHIQASLGSTFDAKAAANYLAAHVLSNTRMGGRPQTNQDDLKVACELLELPIPPAAEDDDKRDWHDLDYYPGSAELATEAASSARSAMRVATALAATAGLEQLRYAGQWNYADGAWHNAGEGLEITDLLTHLQAVGFRLTDDETALAGLCTAPSGDAADA